MTFFLPTDREHYIIKQMKQNSDTYAIFKQAKHTTI